MRSIILILLFLILTKASANGQSLFGRDWKDGYYYDLAGHKVTGLLSREPPSQSLFKGRGDHIFFKKDSDGVKKKISSDSLKSFVVGADSFTVSRYAELQKKPFLQVMVDKPTKLYFSSIARQSSMGGVGGIPIGIGFSGGTKTTYYYGPNPDELKELDRKSFIDVMSKIMADKPKVVDLIKNKTYHFSNIEDLIKFYTETNL